jgi:hypothetical protein
MSVRGEAYDRVLSSLDIHILCLTRIIRGLLWQKAAPDPGTGPIESSRRRKRNAEVIPIQAGTGLMTFAVFVEPLPVSSSPGSSLPPSTTRISDVTATGDYSTGVVTYYTSYITDNLSTDST